MIEVCTATYGLLCPPLSHSDSSSPSILMNSNILLGASEAMRSLFGNMDPRALTLRLQTAVQSTSRCSGVSDSMSQNRQLEERDK